MNFTVLENFMNHITETLVPGNSIVVYINNIKVYEYSSGYADIENKIPMTGDELINIYSCSKVTTVTAALQLFEKEKFSLDDPLSKFIPEYKNMKVRTKDGVFDAEKPITLRNLFTMTAGFTYNTKTPSFDVAREKTNGRMNTVEVIRCLANEPLCMQPGERFEYSLCHDVLAAVVEIISGKKFRDYVKENVFDPLEIKAYYHKTPEIEERMAQQYICRSSETDIVKLQQKKSTGIIENTGLDNSLILGDEYDSGGAGIITSVKDYGKLASALSCGGIGGNGNRILKAETVELLKTNQLDFYGIDGIGWEHLTGYGYGLGVRTLMDKEKAHSPGNLGEFGWGGAAGATVLCDTKERAALFYAHHMLNPQEAYYQPKLRNAFYESLYSE